MIEQLLILKSSIINSKIINVFFICVHPRPSAVPTCFPKNKTATAGEDSQCTG
jgi:hypothetical protein